MTDEAQRRALIAEMLARGRARWPEIELDATTFVRHVETRCSAADLAQLDGASLYLACACAHGDAAALRALQSGYRPVLERVLRRFDGGLRDEILQQVYDLLLVSTDKRSAAILKYDGRAELGSWLVVVARREGARIAKRRDERDRRERPSSDALEVAGRLNDPELDHAKARYGAAFKSSFETAFHELSVQDRNIFRYEYLDSLNLDEMARLCDVSRATMARWRTRARERLLAGTRRCLKTELSLDSAAMDSVMQLIESRLEVSLTRVLARSRE